MNNIFLTISQHHDDWQHDQSDGLQLSDTSTLEFNEVFEQLHNFNIAVLSGKQHGGTSLIRQLINQRFQNTAHTTYIVKYSRAVKKRNLILNFLDIPGIKSRQHLEMNQEVIKHCQIIFITFSTAESNWKQQVVNWLSFLKSCKQQQQMLVLIGTQIDLNPRFSFEQFQTFANKYRFAQYFLCSAKTGEGIQDILEMPLPNNLKQYDINVEKMTKSCC